MHLRVGLIIVLPSHLIQSKPREAFLNVLLTDISSYCYFGLPLVQQQQRRHWFSNQIRDVLQRNVRKKVGR